MWSFQSKGMQAVFNRDFVIKMLPAPRFEPTNFRLESSCVEDWPSFTALRFRHYKYKFLLTAKSSLNSVPWVVQAQANLVLSRQVQGKGKNELLQSVLLKGLEKNRINLLKKPSFHSSFQVNFLLIIKTESKKCWHQTSGIKANLLNLWRRCLNEISVSHACWENLWPTIPSLAELP